MSGRMSHYIDVIVASFWNLADPMLADFRRPAKRNIPAELR